MNSFWQIMFHFPDGGVWSNIVASIIWALLIQAPIVTYALIKQARHHHVVETSLRSLHTKFDAKGSKKPKV